MSEDKNKFIALYHFLNKPQDFNFEMNYYEFRDELKTLLDLYQKEKEKDKELEKQNKILEVEKVRYNIQYLESDISQTPDTAMVYHSMKKHLETLKEEKIKLEAELQELLEERNK